MVSKPIDGEPAGHANRGTIGFTMSDAKQAEAWHKAGVADGCTSIEDPPGVRQGAAGQTYLAYFRDPDGNKLVALCRMPTAWIIARQNEEGCPVGAALPCSLCFDPVF
jgi:hypothetical protein